LKYLAHTSSFIFVGYSGSAESVTVTLAAVAAVEEDASRDYVVDPRGLASVAATDYGKTFVAALGGDAARSLEMTSSEFFSALRIQVFPLLLERPAAVSRQQLSGLCELTRIDNATIEPALNEVVAAWRDLGPDGAQEVLPALLPEYAQEVADHPYIPIVPASEPIALVWLISALMLWSDVATLNLDVLQSTESVGKPFEFVILSAGMLRRDVAAISGVSSYVETHRTQGLTIVGVVLGDVGPLPEVQVVNPVVTRPRIGRSVVRPTGPACVWIQGTELLSVFKADQDAEVTQAALRETVRERLGVA
jgi:hypothetical protein